MTSHTHILTEAARAAAPAAWQQPTYAFSEAIPEADATCDACDLWDDEMDPERERGDFVTALFTIGTGHDSTILAMGHGLFREVEHSYAVHHLIGFTVESRDFIRFVDREEVQRIIGEGRICDLEDIMDEGVNG